MHYNFLLQERLTSKALNNKKESSEISSVVYQVLLERCNSGRCSFSALVRLGEDSH